MIPSPGTVYAQPAAPAAGRIPALPQGPRRDAPVLAHAVRRARHQAVRRAEGRIPRDAAQQRARGDRRPAGRRLPQRRHRQLDHRRHPVRSGRQRRPRPIRSASRPKATTRWNTRASRRAISAPSTTSITSRRTTWWRRSRRSPACSTSRSATPRRCPASTARSMAQADGVTRMFGGDGGDELFGGNERYAKQHVFARYEQVPGLLRQRPAGAGRVQFPGAASTSSWCARRAATSSRPRCRCRPGSRPTTCWAATARRRCSPTTSWPAPTSAQPLASLRTPTARARRAA